MYTKTDLLAFDYWNKLSSDNKLKILQDNNFWDGFSQYLWDYLPECLKTIIRLKIDKNE